MCVLAFEGKHLLQRNESKGLINKLTHQLVPLMLVFCAIEGPDLQS